jgi:trimeric autotransporter adhesin
MRTATRMVVLNSKKYALDLISVRAAAAYGLRRLYASWTGVAIRVRRSSDNAERDIGFIGEHLDVLALLVFVGNGSGFVTTWYDQSGNGRHATQVTVANQPQIVSNGVIAMPADNFRSAIIGSGYLVVISPSVTVAMTSAVASYSATSDSYSAVFSARTSSNNIGTSDILLAQSNGPSSTSPFRWGGASYVFASSVWRNGVAYDVETYNRTVLSVAANTTQVVTVGWSTQSGALAMALFSDSYLQGGSRLFKGWGQEIILFSSALSTIDRQLLERDQGIYFNISVS